MKKLAEALVQSRQKGVSVIWVASAWASLRTPTTSPLSMATI
ncbi:hypothetical protein [Pseudomonas sp. TWI929]